MDTIKKAAVIIPFYKDTLTAFDSVALRQCHKMLSAYPIIAIKPNSLVLPDEVTNYPFFKTVNFADDYFKDVQGYNRLLLDETFYRQFLDYEYILIHQLDAFVFKNELQYWCSQGIDYVGAPWIKPVKPRFFILSRLRSYLQTRFNTQKDSLPSEKQLEYKVGNGGFSLRKTRIFYDLCITQKVKIKQYNSNSSHYFNEDIFWSIEVNRKRKLLNIPGYKKALKFAFEFNPERAFITNKHQLPFGCHGWDINIDFWRPIFKELGYEV
jgi:hypothetical protein